MESTKTKGNQSNGHPMNLNSSTLD